MDRRRKLEVRWKAWPNDRQAAQVAGRSKGGAGGSVGGASRRSTGRLGRRVGRRRKPEIGRKAGRGSDADESRRLSRKATPEGWQPTQVGGRSESEAEGVIGGASCGLAQR